MSFSYNVGKDLIEDLDCQKKFICESFRHKKALGEIGARFRHSVDLFFSEKDFPNAEVFLPNLDEFQEAKEKGEEKNGQSNCELLFWQCQTSLLDLVR